MVRLVRGTTCDLRVLVARLTGTVIRLLLRRRRRRLRHRRLGGGSGGVRVEY